MPKNKITVGMATYGRSFTLSNPRDHGVKASAFIGPAGPVTRQKGVWSYYEVCTGDGKAFENSKIKKQIIIIFETNK